MFETLPYLMLHLRQLDQGLCHVNIKNKLKLMYKKIISIKKAEIKEVNIKSNQKIIPKLQFGKPIEVLVLY